MGCKTTPNRARLPLAGLFHALIAFSVKSSQPTTRRIVVHGMTVIAAHPGMLMATSGFGQLIVFRSPTVRTTDTIYRPVAEYVARTGAVPVHDEVVIDPHAYMGAWSMTIYRIDLER